MIFTPLLRIIIVSASLAGYSSAAAPYRIPGEAGFPMSAELTSFSYTISGRLKNLPTYASVCYDEDWNDDACQRLFKSASSGVFHVELPNVLIFTNWELDGNAGCPQPLALPTAPLPGGCTLGIFVYFSWPMVTEST
jgi:hypothetical protein